MRTRATTPRSLLVGAATGVVALVTAARTGPALTAWVRKVRWEWSAEHRVRGWLFEAGYRLVELPAVRYIGTATTLGGARVDVDARFSPDGPGLAILRRAAVPAEVLAVDDHVHVRAPAEFWQLCGEPAAAAADHEQTWVDVDLLAFGVDVDHLAPAVLSDEVDLAAWEEDFRLGPVRRIAGVRAREVTLPTCVVHVTSTAPHRVVRVERRPSARGRSDLGDEEDRVRVHPDEVCLDVHPLSPAEPDIFACEVEHRLGELRRQHRGTVEQSGSLVATVELAAEIALVADRATGPGPTDE